MADGNPFGAPPVAPGGGQYGAAQAGYPFDAGSSSQMQGSVVGNPMPGPSPYGGGPSSYPAMMADPPPPPPPQSQHQPADNPFGSPLSPPASAAAAAAYGQQQQQQQQPFGSPYSQQQQPASSTGPFSPSGYSMVSAAASAPAAMGNPFQQHQQAADSIVVSQYPSNPYASGMMMNPQNQQQLQHQHQHGHGGGGAAASFDPFARPPPPPPPPAAFPTTTDMVPAPASNPYGQMVAYGNPAAAQDPFGSATSVVSYSASAPAPLPSSYPEDEDPLAAFGGTPHPDSGNDAKTKETNGSGDSKEPSRPRDRGERPGSYDSSSPNRPIDDRPSHLGPPQYDYGQRSPDSSTPGPNEPTLSPHVRNPYREELARRAPPGASPLPKADLVRKRGYVLSRISFRTIVMKKWKQSYWVQYGPHTMLWFRSEADFTDWINNPYHDQAQRNFLIKLAVNFVHDLYKPNVRGYQVTQCRTKAYGNKMVRQFKLERWMDYGPTIAAAFGSYNPREVDELREAIVECMRNTPLNSGIRATGAVRQRPSQSQDSEDTYNRRDDQSEDSERSPDDRNGRRAGNERPTEEQNGKSGADSVAEESDLLDVDNWDDVPGQAAPPNGVGASYQPYQPQQQPVPPQHGYPQPAYGAPPPGPPQQQQPPHPYQQAIVPVTGAPQAYPGAPPPPPDQMSYGMPPSQPHLQQGQPPQSQGYPAAMQDPWGAPPQQQQPQQASQYAPQPPQQPPQQYGQPPQYPQQSAFPYQQPPTGY